MQFLANADPADAPVVVSYRDFLARVTQAANMFGALGVGKGDVVSFLLPLVPDAFVTLFAAEAAGIANPVNPLLEPHQIAEILEAANTKVLVALGPMPGDAAHPVPGWPDLGGLGPLAPHAINHR